MIKFYDFIINKFSNLQDDTTDLILFLNFYSVVKFISRLNPSSLHSYFKLLLKMFRSKLFIFRNRARRLTASMRGVRLTVSGQGVLCETSVCLTASLLLPDTRRYSFHFDYIFSLQQCLQLHPNSFNSFYLYILSLNIFLSNHFQHHSIPLVFIYAFNYL